MLFQDGSRPVRMSQVRDRASEVSYAFSDLVLLHAGNSARAVASTPDFTV